MKFRIAIFQVRYFVNLGLRGKVYQNRFINLLPFKRHFLYSKLFSLAYMFQSSCKLLKKLTKNVENARNFFWSQILLELPDYTKFLSPTKSVQVQFRIACLQFEVICYLKPNHRIAQLIIHRQLMLLTMQAKDQMAFQLYVDGCLFFLSKYLHSNTILNYIYLFCYKCLVIFLESVTYFDT